MSRFLSFAAVAVMLLQGNASSQNSYVVESGNTRLRVSSTGELISIAKKGSTWKKSLSGFTSLDSCTREQKVSIGKTPNNGIQFIRKFSSAHKKYHVTVVDRFIPDSVSIRWEVEIEGSESPWSTGIATTMNFPDTARARFWTTWGDPNQVSPANWGEEPGSWHNPFETRPFRDMHLIYGARFEKGAGYSVPVFSVMYPKEKTGISLAMSPDDPLLDVHMVTTRNGVVRQIRKFNRLERGKKVSFTMHIFVHDADWRSVMSFMVARYPRYFVPRANNALEVCGLGAYSSNEGDVDVATYQKMGGIVNWKASFDFSYMGMFIPPVDTDTTRWKRFDVTSGGALIAHKRTYTSIEQMRRYATRMKDLGFFMLNYFNATEFGGVSEFADSVVYPKPEFSATANVWNNPSAFLYTHFPEAILFGSLDLGASPEQYTHSPVTFHNQPYWTWGRAIVTDAGDSAYAQFLEHQAQLHVDKFPDATGIAIDRLDWFTEYNWHADDGRSWVAGRPVRAMLNSYKSLLPRLAGIFHSKNKVVFCNPLMNRLDMMEHIDGLFNEFGYIGHNLNQSAFLALFKPLLSWTLDSTTVLKSPDRYFQSHILMGAFPTAPFPGNDHCIGPNPEAERYYLDYGPMFTQLHGRKWVLLPGAVEVRDDSTLCNIFTAGTSVVVPIVLGTTKATTLVIRHCKELLHSSKVLVEIWHPAADTPETRDAIVINDECTLHVPLIRGCAFVVLKPR